MDADSTTPVLLIHGGAGVIGRNVSPGKQQAIRASLHEALRRGHACLRAGDSALDAVCAAVTAMEHAPHVMLIGEGAEALAHERGIAFAAPEYFRTEERWRELQNALANQA